MCVGDGVVGGGGHAILGETVVLFNVALYPGLPSRLFSQQGRSG